MGHYSAMKKNKVLMDTTGMNFKHIMLGKRSQTQMTTYCILPLIGLPGDGKNHRDRKQINDCWELGVQEGVNYKGSQRSHLGGWNCSIS